jgi:hypothetical protein
MNNEKTAIEAIQAAIQRWLEPQLKSLNARMTQIDAWLEDLERRIGWAEKRTERLEANTAIRFENQHREIFAHLDAVRAEIRRVETVANFRERLATLEAKFAQQG